MCTQKMQLNLNLGPENTVLEDLIRLTLKKNRLTEVINKKNN